MSPFLLSPLVFLVLLRTFSQQQRQLLSYGALHAARWEREGGATTIAEGGGPLSYPLLSAVTFILFTLSWQTEAARGK